jgi:hypothetical protein
MRCPAPDRLLETLAGGKGSAVRTAAEAHVRVCASCRALVDALVTPSDTLIRFVTATGPASLGGCPELEDLACWCTGGPLPPEGVRRVALHVSGCEACAFLAAQLRLEIGPAAEHSFGRLFQHQSGPAAGAPMRLAVSRAPVVAQCAGAVLFVLFAAAILVPKLSRLDLPRLEFPSAVAVGQRPAQPAPAAWPLQASFEFRLKGSSETHSLWLPHYPGVQLSEGYEYGVHLNAHRAGWLLLFSVDQGGRLSVLVPAGGPSNRVPHLDTGQTLRFPPEPEWEPITAVPGQRKLYAVFLDSIAVAEELLNESERPDASGLNEALAKKLDEGVVGGCSSVDRPCVLKLEYEVF